MFTYLRLACCFLRRTVRPRCDIALENLALRQQLAVLTRSSRRPRLTRADRLFWSWLSRAWPRWRSALVLVQPDTVVRWHRTAWRLTLATVWAATAGPAQRAARSANR